MKRIPAVVLMLWLAAACTTMTSRDSAIQGAIHANLQADHLDGVQITVMKLHVVLEGSVRSREEFDQAQRDAERVDGVMAVRNNLQIAPPG